MHVHVHELDFANVFQVNNFFPFKHHISSHINENFSWNKNPVVIPFHIWVEIRFDVILFYFMILLSIDHMNLFFTTKCI